MPVEVTSSVQETQQQDEEEGSEVQQTSKPMVGIIYPPPEVRNIVDKTASFVARNGPEFESRIRQNEISNAKFNFLNHGDPYHAYYQHKVKEFQEGKPSEQTGIITKIAPILSKTVQQVVEPAVPKESPPEWEFIADPPSISAFELDIVKLTAQFVARNGRQFLTTLMNKEQRNYLFDFLRPQHSMFNYFTKLVEQYTKVLIPPKDVLAKLRKEGENPKSVMEQVKHRVEWARVKNLRNSFLKFSSFYFPVAYAQIDWHDFVVVETVDFQPDEPGHFPPPVKPSEVGARVIAEERYEQFGETLHEEDDVVMDVESEEEEEEQEDGEKEESRQHKVAEKPKEKIQPADQNTEVQDMDEGDSDMEESSDEEEPPIPIPPPMIPPMPPAPMPALPRETTPMPPPLPPQPEEVEIRKDYNPKAPKQVDISEESWLVSPLTREKIPADKLAQHMKIGMLDPRWIEQRDRQMQEKTDKHDVFAQGDAMKDHLTKLAERRTDIFGVGDVETGIGKKLGEEEDDKQNKDKVIWDGHSASMEATTRKAQANITVGDQIAANQKAEGFLPDAEKEKIGPAKPFQKYPVQNIPRSMHMPKPVPAPLPAPPKPPMMGGPRPPMQPMGSGAPLLNQPPLMQVAPPRPVMAMPVRPRTTLLPSSGPQGFMQGRPVGMPQPPMGMQMVRQPGPPPPQARMMQDEPPAKKQKTEESLIPEDQFLATNPGQVTFRVQLPNVPDKPEWKLAGQIVTMTLPLTDSVSVIKAKLMDDLNMPVGKQKLQYEGLFIKDSNSLAYYNMSAGSIVQLQVKERGGRKR
ncbi:splicing factor 3A subunit 1-like [Anneissia japonica]|uniref:splicing factor 3A subunit 1-like n=1 Tax=Anneissia japonica TaxID=1529436 RepID=UPI0014256D49|nr:splicing factor 3A subunit 1-like [Anneissia japonica]